MIFALIDNVEFWRTLSALFWPATVIVIFLSAKSYIFRFLDRDGLTIKVAGMEISVADATKNIGTEVADLQKKLSELEATVKETNSDSRPEKTLTESNSGGENVEIQNKPTTLLWVDDYPINNAFLVDRFRNDGINVVLSLSTKDALKTLGYGGIDIIITDLGRKEEGFENPFAGSDLIKAIRSRNQKVPIMVFAGQRGLENKDRLLQEGADAVTASGVEVQTFVNRHKGRSIPTASPASAPSRPARP
ncbi:response regulator [Methylocystis iwaonis]|uniref:response regulator n=1 Tax=Methylocystis iwaonis TaxID=2885079 RepID=UPI002E7AB236|nr:response regulator [Methylocystis iwaonis]